VVYSRDDKDVGVDLEVNTTHKMMMGQYWLCKTKPKRAFRMTRNASKSCYGISLSRGVFCQCCCTYNAFFMDLPMSYLVPIHLCSQRKVSICGRLPLQQKLSINFYSGYFDCFEIVVDLYCCIM